jgi:hypothetical protein
MGRAHCLQALTHDALGEFGFVAVPAQVAEVKMTQFGGHDFRHTIRRGFVREMTVPAENALLQIPRATHAILQKLYVVIGLEHQRVGRAEAFKDELRDVAKVGGETDFDAVGM